VSVSVCLYVFVGECVGECVSMGVCMRERGIVSPNGIRGGACRQFILVQIPSTELMSSPSRAGKADTDS
jgi:hypothetical protein